METPKEKKRARIIADLIDALNRLYSLHLERKAQDKQFERIWRITAIPLIKEAEHEINSKD